jgi:N-acetylglucosaminyldiphosphoundecaprenol N-acetyl-beta-D-mannosaminyltransferase
MIKFANLIFKGLTKEIVFKEEKYLKIIIPTNAEVIVKANENEKLKDIINKNFSTFDGQVPYALAKLQNKGIEFEKISGSDLIYDFCQMAKDKNYKVFLLGGYEDSNKITVKKLQEKYNIEIKGYSPAYEAYPFSKTNNDTILNKIESFKPDILFVGFGAPKQEFWIDDNKQILEDIGVKWAIGSGGSFEFVAGKIKRAPKIVQKIGLEGIWRFLLEPKWFRFKRLLISLKIFKYLWR